ncbi:hypothetical protein CNL04410 [Cryptococcus deneoformans JEC21]|uniref:GRF-type domain-containing protein n=1 Tax=Cryptococcus deneoformans (strain JEC21 / ATCC MYA-565) TaxID=214684 RepID=Q5K8V0_CRYD1|nr:hypothetical protein CNL04410 [Cryptococcus neoformans var. neoformans JEC21]AAW46696.2 hypothetical protein CNL04410 [Cryptococcus neoformans var. neoformans JEC21]
MIVSGFTSWAVPERQERRTSPISHFRLSIPTIHPSPSRFSHLPLRNIQLQMPAYTARNTRVSTPRRIQITAATPSQDEDGNVVCTGHNRRCKRFVSSSTKNPNRAFYVCPLPREDPKRCKFFVWEDEIHKNAKSDQAPETPCVGRSRFGGSTGQALGQTPVGHSSSSVGLHTPHSLSKGKQAASVLSDNEDDLVPVEDDIDWGAVDVDGLEREAIAGSQNSVKKHGTRDSISSTPTLGFNERLSSVMTGMKRDREEEDEDLRTPKKANIDSNPFVSSPAGTLPPHPKLLPSISTMEQLNDELYRMDRLLQGSEKLKQGLRNRVKDLESKNKALQDRVKELEARLKQE